jgi:hypothetical protein
MITLSMIKKKVPQLNNNKIIDDELSSFHTKTMITLLVIKWEQVLRSTGCSLIIQN